MNNLLRLCLVLVTVSFCVATAHAEDAKDTKDTKDTEAADKAKKEDKPKGEKYPVGASASLSYGFNHAKFVESNGDFGYQRVSASANVSYSIMNL